MERNMSDPRDNRPRRTPEDIRQNALRNSTNVERQIPEVAYDNRRKSSFKSSVIALATAALIAVSSITTLFIWNTAQTVAQDRSVTEYFSEEGFYDSIENCRWERVGNSGYEYGYNQSRLAEWASSSNNPDVALFSIYGSVPFSTREWNMNEVVSKVVVQEGEGQVRYQDFSDYLTCKGFVDKDGKPSTEVYEKVMTERVVAEKKISDIASSNGIRK